MVDLASRFQLPVVTLVDTQGAHPGLESEEQGVGNAVATTLSLMAEAPTPIVSAIVGEGGSEAALALGIADSILMQRYAVFTPAPTAPTPSRLHKGLVRNQTEPEELVLTAYDCKELGLIDEVVTEPRRGRPYRQVRRCQRTGGSHHPESGLTGQDQHEEAAQEPLPEVPQDGGKLGLLRGG